MSGAFGSRGMAVYPLRLFNQPSRKVLEKDISALPVAIKYFLLFILLVLLPSPHPRFFELFIYVSSFQISDLISQVMNG